MEFNYKDAKYKQALKDLELITGLPFSLEKAKNGHDELWVFRVVTPATYAPNYDLISNYDGSLPISIKSSRMFAVEKARTLFNNLYDFTVLRDIIQEHNVRVDRVEVPNFLGVAEGSFKGALDFSAESKGKYQALNLEKLREEAKKIEVQNKSKNKYHPPELDKLLSHETNYDDLKLIASKLELWSNRSGYSGHNVHQL